MKPRNRVYIAVSLDGYIADRDGGLAWLEEVTNPEGDDLGYGDFMTQTDALLMGRATFETVCGFGGEWPYAKPVYVLSRTMTEIPKAYHGKAFLVSGSLAQVLETIHERGHFQLYVDGGNTITSLLTEDRIDEMIITVFPVLLGGGSRLFGDLPAARGFEVVRSRVCLGKLVQTHYRRLR